MTPFTDGRHTRALAITGILGAAAFPFGSATGAVAAFPSARIAATPAPILLAPPVTAATRWAPAGSRAVAELFGRVTAAATAGPARGAVSRMVAAGDRIARLPYVWGGGHSSFTAAGYDCSGSVSYVLHAAGLLSAPEDSGALESFGDAGPGRHVTIYANAQHAWMTIDGRRFDTIALQETGTRWSTQVPSGAGYVMRHPRGL